MDVRFINPFVVTIRQVFKTMANVEVQVQKPRLKTSQEGGADVSGIIGFSGDAAGACILGFPKEVACSLAGAFSGESMTIDHPDFSDAIGELANMVAGGAKAQFDGLNVAISLPSVVIGSSHAVSVTLVPANHPRLMIPCETPLGHFHVEVVVVAKNVQVKNAPTTAAAGATS